VQYRETDFNFISRLMEQEGIYYFFEHEDGKHHLVLADAYSSHAACPNYDKIAYESVTQEDATANASPPGASTRKCRPACMP